MDFIRTLLGRFKGTKFPEKEATSEQAETDSTADISSFISLISELDSEAIESARDRVKGKHLKQLMEHYWTLEDWDQKMCLVDLIQDQAHEGLRKLMLDYLRVPPTTDSRQIAQAAALRFVDEEYDQFMRYYNDRELLGNTVAQVLKAESLTPAPVPVIKARPKAPAAALGARPMSAS